MKKSIFTLAIAAIVASSMSIMAQEPEVEMPPMPTGKQNNQPVRVIKENPLTRNLFLTEEQKERLESLENPFLPQSMERRIAHNRQAKSPHDLNQPQDSIDNSCENVDAKQLRREPRIGGEIQPDNVEEVAFMRGEYLRRVKKILNEEQYVKYLENLLMYTAPNQRSNMGGFPAGNVHHRGPKGPHTPANTELIR